MVVEGGLGHPHAGGDLAQRGLLVSLLDEEIEGDVQDPLARAGLTLAVPLVAISFTPDGPRGRRRVPI